MAEKWDVFRRTSPPGSPFEIRMPNGGALLSSGPVTEEQARTAAAAPELREALAGIVELATGENFDLQDLQTAAMEGLELLSRTAPPKPEPDPPPTWWTPMPEPKTNATPELDPKTTNATTRLAMMRAVQKLQQANIARVKGAPGVGYSVEQMAEILERESGYRELYEALQAICQYGQNLSAATQQTPINLIWAGNRALAKCRGESPDAK